MKSFAIIALLITLVLGMDPPADMLSEPTAVLREETSPPAKPVCPVMPVQSFPGQVAGYAAFQYEGTHGNLPANWSNLNCATPPFDIFAGCSYCSNECGGSAQSPVNVIPAKATRLAWLAPVTFEPLMAEAYYQMASGSFKINCKELGTCGRVTVGSKVFDLLQIHTHQQSEHMIDGKLYPSEMHFVHIHNGSELLVFGVMFQEGAANPNLQTYIDIATAQGSGMVNFKGIAGDAIELSHFTLYSGSLTTPPCSEGVRWAVSSKPQNASREQLVAMFKLAGGKVDNRPVQDMNGRLFLNF